MDQVDSSRRTAHRSGDKVIQPSRRVFVNALVALVTGTIATLQLHGAYARHPAPRRIGILLVGPSLESKETQAFRQGLRTAGYAEGRDVVIEWRSASGDYDK